MVKFPDCAPFVIAVFFFGISIIMTLISYFSGQEVAGMTLSLTNAIQQMLIMMAIIYLTYYFCSVNNPTLSWIILLSPFIILLFFSIVVFILSLVKTC